MIPSEAIPCVAEQSNFEVQIRSTETHAYASVLRAFSAQSDALTWKKEELISDLRKELRVSDLEHRQLLLKINSDEPVRAIRKWRQSNSNQQHLLPESLSISHVVHKSVGNNSAYRRKLKMTKMAVASPRGCFPQTLSAAPDQPSVILLPYRDKKWCADDSVTYYTQGNVEHPRVPIANSWQMQTYLEGREPLASVKLDKNILRGDTIQIRNTDMVIREVQRMCQAGQHDQSEMRKARHLLKVHKKCLEEAIEKLSDNTDKGIPFNNKNFATSSQFSGLGKQFIIHQAVTRENNGQGSTSF